MSSSTQLCGTVDQMWDEELEPGWMVEEMEWVVNVIPVRDLRDHSRGKWCKCAPWMDTDEYNRAVCVHNAWDGREFYEEENHAGCLP